MSSELAARFLKNPKAMALLGTVFLVYGLGMVVLDLSRSGWKETEGKVITKEGNASKRSRGLFRGRKLGYRYQVGANQYYGDTRRIQHTFFVSLNQSINVYYDPDNPRRSALSAGLTGFPLTVTAIGAALFVPLILHRTRGVAPYPGRTPNRRA